MKKILCLCCLLTIQFVHADTQNTNNVDAVNNEQQEFKKYFSLAEAGDSEAQFFIGRAYYQGEKIPKNYPEAFKWFYKAANQGDVRAASVIAGMYQVGEGVPKNYEQSLKWYRIAASQGDESSQFNLGEMYCKKDQRTPKLMPVCYALLSLSAPNDPSGVSEAALNMRIKEMTEEEIKAGKELAEEMKKPDNLLIALDGFVKANWK